MQVLVHILQANFCVFSSLVVCPIAIASGDPRQGQHTQHEVALMMCTVTVEAAWLDHSIYSIHGTKDQETFGLCCKYSEYVESTTDQKI